MNIPKFVGILLILFLSVSSNEAKKDSESLISSNFMNRRVKREIDLEVFSDMNEVKKDDNDGDIIYVCGKNKEFNCKCDAIEKYLWCDDKKLKTPNLQPVDENFVLQKVYLTSGNNFTLEKGKLFPGNEERINFLYLGGMNFVKIESGVFDDLTSLETLNFHSRTFPFLSENIFTKKLGKILLNLQLFFCNLIDIKLSAFKNLMNLESLYLTGNQQSDGRFNDKFPESLSKLKDLSIGSCNLSYIDDGIFEHLKSLEKLDLGGNGFASLPSALKILPNLNHLDLRRNQFVKLEKNMFSSNVKLEFLHCRGNYKLKYVESCAFCYLTNLKEVKLFGSSDLSYIDENAFGAISNGFTPALDKFDISDCNISVLHENLLDWKNVKTFNLAKNPFVCNCSMAWLFKDLISNNSIYESKLVTVYHKFILACVGPPPTSPNHTIPYTLAEIFSACKNSSSSNSSWYLLTLFGFAILIVFIILIYTNHYRLNNYFSRFF